MRFKGTAALAAVLIGIVFYYFLIDLPSEKRKNRKKKTEQRKLFYLTRRMSKVSPLSREKLLSH